MFTGLIAKLGLNLLLGKAVSNAKRDWAAISPKVKLWLLAAVLAVALLIGGRIYHGHKVRELVAATKAEQKAADDLAWRKKLEDAHRDALAWKGRAEQQGATIARLNKEKHDVEIRDHAAVADALSVRGPGAAASHCGPGDHPAAPSLAGGRNQAAADADAAGSAMPAGDWAVVPWTWLVRRGQEHDDLLTDEATRRSADKQQRDAWEKMRAPGK